MSYEPCLPPPGTRDGSTHVLACGETRIALRWFNGAAYVTPRHWCAFVGQPISPGSLGRAGWRYVSPLPSAVDDTEIHVLRRRVVSLEEMLDSVFDSAAAMGRTLRDAALRKMGEITSE